VLSRCLLPRHTRLRGVVETPVSHRRDIAQSSLNLIGYCKRGQEILAASIAHLGSSEDCTKIVRRVACFAGRDVAVHEIQVSGECTIEERHSIWCGLAAPDESRERFTAEFVGQFPNGVDNLCIKGANSHSNRI
jgi:hypothetical protein